MPTVTPTIWGLSPTQLHDRFWATRGVHVVRANQPEPLDENAPFFLLIESTALILFDPTHTEQALSRVESELMYVHLRDIRDHRWRERVVTDEADQFVRFERVYVRPRHRLARAAMTSRIAVAKLWQSAASSREGWQRIRRGISKSHRAALDANGMLYDGSLDTEVADLVNGLVRYWPRPDISVERAMPAGPGAWMDRESFVSSAAKIVPPVWIGAGRRAESGMLVIGPAILWDSPQAKVVAPPIQWNKIAWRDSGPLPLPINIDPPVISPRFHRRSKRLFDILFSLVAILLSLPLYPLIMLAILYEDGWPCFFTHRRESVGGREFPCIKFRSMYRNAEKIRGEIGQQNKADGPQFYIPNDPRLTRVGRVLRKIHLDELPQFVNVLLGQMSVVGPRPSPFSENQFCPAWRDARLSLRPGITGLWQVKRTRAPGTDFQEWIRYDLEYVENARWSLDLLIIWKTFAGIVWPKKKQKIKMRNETHSAF